MQETTMPLDPALAAVLDQLNASDGPKLHEVDPEQARIYFDAMQMPTPEIALASVEDRTVPGPAGEIPVRVYRPEGGETLLPALIYLHGGGWVIGSIETHDATCRELARDAGCVVVSVDYRLAPENRYPAAAEDCYAALEWLAANGEALGIDTSRLAVGGDSAGGNLAAVISLMARDRSGPEIALQLLIYPVTDADFSLGSYVKNATGYLLETDAMIWFWDHYVPDPARRLEGYAAPLRAENLSGLPRTLVLTAEFDPLRDEGEAYARRLETSGVPVELARYDGMIHGFFAMTMLVQGARDALARSAATLREAFGEIDAG